MPALSRRDLAEWKDTPTWPEAAVETEESTHPRWWDLPEEWDAYGRWAGLEAPHWGRGT